MIRRLALLGATAGAFGIGPALAAATQDPVPIGPDEPFLGFVNGAPSAAVIQMACVGPIKPGEKGHPLAGQSTEVQLSNTTASGFTGNARKIRATLTYPSPAPPLPIVLATFSNYFVPAPISTELLLPCAGRGDVVFTPMNGGSRARAWHVAVTFVGQP